MIGNKVVEIIDANDEKNIRELLNSSYQRVKRFFVLADDNTAKNDQVSINSVKKHFRPRVEMENYNIEIDERIFHYQWINDSVK